MRNRPKDRRAAYRAEFGTTIKPQNIDVDAELGLAPQAEPQPEAEPQTDAVVFKSHPTYGDITESDIQATMRQNNMTREQVLSQLGGQ